MHVGEKLKRLRVESGLTQKDLAKRLTSLGHERGMTAISSWETGKSEPVFTEPFIHALATALDISTTALMKELGLVEHSGGDSAIIERLLRAKENKNYQEGLKWFTVLMSGDDESKV